MSDNTLEMQQRALLDLTKRAKGGIILYVLVWLAIGLPNQLMSSAPVFFYFNLAVFLVFMILRTAHLIAVSRCIYFSARQLTNWLIVIVSLGALHWGLLVAWIVHFDEYSSIRFLMLLATPGFAIGGAMALSISNTIRIVYPAAMYLPGIVALALSGNYQYEVLSLLGLFSLVYVLITTADVHTDYWNAMKDHLGEQKRADLMQEISYTDPLTQVRNRMFFDKRFKDEWKRSSRSNSPLSVLMLDLDRFKSINDTYGHSFGDDYLKKVAKTLADEIQRGNDCMARYGGEEFVFLLPDTDADNAKTIATRLLQSIANAEIHYQGKPVPITCSIGGSTMIPGHQIKQDYLLKKADEALYQAKNNGRNQYCESV